MHRFLISTLPHPYQSLILHASFSLAYSSGDKEAVSVCPGGGGGVHGGPPECLHVPGAHCVLHEDPVQGPAER